MPNWKTHIAIGIFVNVLIFLALYLVGIVNIPELDLWHAYWFILIIPVTIIYSILPDIDTDDSKIRQYIDIILIIFFLIFLALYMYTKNVVYLFGTLFLVILLILLISLEHRGIVHSMVAGLLFSIPLYFIAPPLTVFALTAFTSHIAADGEFKII